MIRTLRLQNFRSYADKTFDFSDGVNIIVGPNASGKTNLLEAIMMVCRGHSFRVSDYDLIMHNKPWARIDAQIIESSNDHPRTHTIKLERRGGSHDSSNINKTYSLANNVYQRFSTKMLIPAVLFEPNHLQLLTESPELRRTFLDDIIQQITPGYATLRRTYKRTLAQRNSLLKQPFTQDQLFIWNVRLSELGGQLAQARQSFIETYQITLQELYNSLADAHTPTKLHYMTKLSAQNYASIMLKHLEASIAVDQERGYTTVGPHRDDLGIRLRGHSLLQAASRGETRTMLLALKLLEARAIAQVQHKKPLLLLDDVFSELDVRRRAALTRFIEDHQTFITTTDADIISANYPTQQITVD